MFALIAYSIWSYLATGSTIVEDSIFWNCATMGNRTCA